MTLRRVFIISCVVAGVGLVVCLGLLAYLWFAVVAADPPTVAYDQSRGVRHGENMEGTGQGTPLIDIEFRRGESVEETGASIADGFPARGMPEWSGGRIVRLAPAA